MNTKTWISLLALVLAACLGLSLWLLRPQGDAAFAEIWSEGKLLYTLDLDQDQTHTITTSKGENTVTIRDGKIAVTAADCPDGYCMDRGYCSGGVQIVCLPHQLIIKFVGEQTVDGAT